MANAQQTNKGNDPSIKFTPKRHRNENSKEKNNINSKSDSCINNKLISSNDGNDSSARKKVKPNEEVQKEQSTKTKPTIEVRGGEESKIVKIKCTKNNTSLHEECLLTSEKFILVLELSLSFLPAGDLGRLAAVSKSFRRYAFADYLRRLVAPVTIHVEYKKIQETNDKSTASKNTKHTATSSIPTLSRTTDEDIDSEIEKKTELSSWIQYWNPDSATASDEKSHPTTRITVPYHLHPNNPWISHAGFTFRPNENNNRPQACNISMWDRRCEIEGNSICRFKAEQEQYRNDENHKQIAYWVAKYKYMENLISLSPSSTNHPQETSKTGFTTVRLQIPDILHNSSRSCTGLSHFSACPLDESLLVVAVRKFFPSDEKQESKNDSGANTKDTLEHIDNREYDYKSSQEVWAILYDMKQVYSMTKTELSSSSATTFSFIGNAAAGDSADLKSYDFVVPCHIRRLSDASVKTNTIEKMRSCDYKAFGGTVRSGNGAVIAVTTNVSRNADCILGYISASATIWNISKTTGFHRRVQEPISLCERVYYYSIDTTLSLSRGGEFFSVMQHGDCGRDGQSWTVYDIRNNHENNCNQEDIRGNDNGETSEMAASCAATFDGQARKMRVLRKESICDCDEWAFFTTDDYFLSTWTADSKWFDMLLKDEALPEWFRQRLIFLQCEMYLPSPNFEFGF